MPTISYTYRLEEPAGHVVISDALMVDRRHLAAPGALWPAPIAKPGHFRPLTPDDARRGQHIAHQINEYLASIRTVNPADLGDDDPEAAMIDACDALDDAVSRLTAALERAYGREAA